MELSTETLSMGAMILSWGKDIFSFASNHFTGICILAAAWFASKSAAKFDRMSYKKEVLNALKFEISLYLAVGEEFDPKDLLDEFYENLDGNKEYSVILPSERHDSVYKSTIQNIHVLPNDAIPVVVQFYTTMNSVEIGSNMINKPDFKSLKFDKKVEMYSQYIHLKSTALELGEDAVIEIDRIIKKFN